MQDESFDIIFSVFRNSNIYLCQEYFCSELVTIPNIEVYTSIILRLVISNIYSLLDWNPFLSLKKNLCPDFEQVWNIYLRVLFVTYQVFMDLKLWINCGINLKINCDIYWSYSCTSLMRKIANFIVMLSCFSWKYYLQVALCFLKLTLLLNKTSPNF